MRQVYHGILILLILSVFLNAKAVHAQNAYAGTDFWIGFIPDETGGSATLKLSVTAATATTATITLPLASPVWTATLTIAANAETIVTVPSSTGGVAVDNEPLNAVSNAGIH